MAGLIGELKTGPPTKSAATLTISAYLEQHSDEFRILDAARVKGWNDPAQDKLHGQKHHKADTANAEEQTRFYHMMLNSAKELHRVTDGFNIPKADTDDTPANIVDFCMAPGAFLDFALDVSRGSRAMAFSLPVGNGGHEIRFSKKNRVQIKLLDINLLAEDMGVTDIPEHHVEAGKSLPSQLPEGERSFDIALCDGMVLRKHTRQIYRERHERERLSLVQLALGLEHLKDGGTMIVRLHCIDEWNSARLLYLFSKISTMKLFKPTRSHTDRVLQDEAIAAVGSWKKLWQAATFVVENDFVAADQSGITPEKVLEEFGDKLVEMGTDIWKMQGDALAKVDVESARTEKSKTAAPTEKWKKDWRRKD